ncbi:MAG: hypothetical protein RIS76_1821 [Verrucomicrobiota bacterium]|jgi:prepilin-type processing-associated H-X9-DG protein
MNTPTNDSANGEQRSAAGFSAVELLVVMSVLAILGVLLLPALSRSRFSSKVTTCANNYRQWGVASAVYASDDGKSRLPSFRLPVEQMVEYKAIEPWFVASEMVPHLAVSGVSVPMWFCPTRPNRFEAHRNNFRVVFGRELITPADLVEEFVRVPKGVFGKGDLNWWVPRRLGESSLEFPDPTRMTTRVPDPWPRRMDDPTISIQPIISDWYLGNWDDTSNTVELRNNSGGHQWAGSLKSINVGFGDGHVDTRPKSKLQWQARGQGWAVYVY